jgi:hypothetical protein
MSFQLDNRVWADKFYKYASDDFDLDDFDLDDFDLDDFDDYEITELPIIPPISFLEP